jgi:photosystem II stability/assembly factor-like uncharacterized protein
MKTKMAALVAAVLIFALWTLGQSWTTQFPQPTGHDLRSVVCDSGGSIWAVGDWGTILHSTDHGQNWSLQNVGSGADLNAITFVDRKSVV